MKWNPNRPPQHFVFEPVELVNELAPGDIMPPPVEPLPPGGVFVPNGVSEEQAIEAARRGETLQPTNPPPQ